MVQKCFNIKLNCNFFILKVSCIYNTIVHKKKKSVATAVSCLFFYVYLTIKFAVSLYIHCWGETRFVHMGLKLNKNIISISVLLGRLLFFLLSVLMLLLLLLLCAANEQLNELRGFEKFITDTNTINKVLLETFVSFFLFFNLKRIFFN